MDGLGEWRIDGWMDEFLWFGGCHSRGIGLSVLGDDSDAVLIL